MNSDLTAAILVKLAFHPDEMRRYQVAAVLTALHRYPAEIAADDVPDAFRPVDHTTAGCCWALLKSDGVHLFRRAGRRMSKSATRNGAWINTYQLASVALAETWLRRHNIEPPPRKTAQLELAQITA